MVVAAAVYRYAATLWPRSRQPGARPPLLSYSLTFLLTSPLTRVLPEFIHAMMLILVTWVEALVDSVTWFCDVGDIEIIAVSSIAQLR